MSQPYSLKDVAEHSKPDSLWVIIDGGVYDVTKFQDEHPGGKRILSRVGGKDASKQFWKYHNDSILSKYSSKLRIGEVKEEAKL